MAPPSLIPTRPHLPCVLAVALIAGVCSGGPTGREIYRTQCASCHGLNGEGVDDEYPEPLHGDRPLDDLVKIIEKTMPEEKPQLCAGEDAKSVAEYLFATFYTEEARLRNKPARIEVSRLTVRQYKNAAADLFVGFTGEGQMGDQRGLRGAYFKTRSYKSNQKAFDRLDAEVQFDFEGGSPKPGTIGDAEFSMRWSGAVIASETGDYEFCLATENGARLWVNDQQTPLIDAWVRSGDDTEHCATVRLLGGRVYPLRLEYFKYKAKSASVALKWRTPHGVMEVIPSRHLTPDWFPPVMVVSTEFPPDDSSVGYERGTSVSQAWDQATTAAALEIADSVIEHLDTLARTKPNAADRVQKIREFCYRFAERAFRRPLTAEQRTFFVDAQFAAEGDPIKAVKRVVILVLKSPRFLYLGLGDDPYAVAERLSFALWDSLPDQPLLNAAAQGNLATPSQIETHAKRMLSNERTKAKLRYFLAKWLHYDRAEDLSRDKTRYPGFDEALLADLRVSLDLFLDDVIWSSEADFRQLLLSPAAFSNARLARFYGAPEPTTSAFERTVLDDRKHAGMLTHPFLMTSHAYYKSSSPIHRGVFLVRGLLGRSLKPPPIAVAPLDEGDNALLTTRQRVELQTKSEACQTCHSLINPLGFALENYDAVGRYREKERETPVDASGSYKTLAGRTVEFTGARQLAEFLADSEEVHQAFAEQLFHHIAKQPLAAYEPGTRDRLLRSFAKANYNIQHLIVEIAKTAALPPSGRNRQGSAR
jgi:hypothetical protein